MSCEYSSALLQLFHDNNLVFAKFTVTGNGFVDYNYLLSLRETMERKIDQCRDKLEKYNTNVQTAQAAVQELVSEKLNIQKDLQQKENLEKSKATLETTIKDLEIEIRVSQLTG